jgi:hypothetical protein
MNTPDKLKPPPLSFPCKVKEETEKAGLVAPRELPLSLPVPRSERAVDWRSL